MPWSGCLLKLKSTSVLWKERKFSQKKLSLPDCLIYYQIYPIQTFGNFTIQLNLQRVWGVKIQKASLALWIEVPKCKQLQGQSSRWEYLGLTLSWRQMSLFLKDTVISFPTQTDFLMCYNLFSNALRIKTQVYYYKEQFSKDQRKALYDIIL